MKLLVLLLIVVYASAADISLQGNECPLEKDLRPCTCVKTCPTCYAFINCANIRSLHELNTVLTNTRDYPFTSFSIINSTFLYIPAATAASKQYKDLRIMDCSMGSLFEEAPSESNVLGILVLNNVKFQRGLDWKLFSPLKALKSLRIDKTNIKRIGDSFGENMPKTLEYLLFERTKTRKLGSHAFEPLKNLQSVSVMNCKISRVERSMFPRPLLANLLNLDGNKIKSLPDDFFTEMPKLKGFSLINNQLKTIAESVFGYLPSNVRAIFVKNNPIECDCKLRWLTIKEKKFFIEGKCGEPYNLEGRELKELKQSDFSYC